MDKKQNTDDVPSIEATLYAARKILRPCPGAKVAGLDLWRAAREVVHQWKMRACTPWELDAAMRDGTRREYLPVFVDMEIKMWAILKPFEFQKVEIEPCKLLSLDQIYKMEDHGGEIHRDAEREGELCELQPPADDPGQAQCVVVEDLEKIREMEKTK